MLKLTKVIIPVSVALCLSACATQSGVTKPASMPNLNNAQARPEMSFYELQKSAQAGNPDSEYALGYMYYYGKGIPQDAEAAALWINKAAAQGQPQAVQALTMLNQTVFTQAAAVHTASASGSMKPNAMVPSAHSLTVDEKHLLGEPRNYFTVQLMSSPRKADVINFMKTHKLTKDVWYYHTTRGSKDWYVLVRGIYKTRHQAEAGLQRLPEKVRDEKPWIDTLENVRKSIKMR